MDTKTKSNTENTFKHTVTKEIVVKNKPKDDKKEEMKAADEAKAEAAQKEAKTEETSQVATGRLPHTNSNINISIFSFNLSSLQSPMSSWEITTSFT